MKVLVDIPENITGREWADYFGCMSIKLYETLADAVPLDDIKTAIKRKECMLGDASEVSGLESALEIINIYTQ